MRTKEATIQVRASKNEKAALQAAARLSGEKLSEYMLEAALLRLEEDLPKKDRSRAAALFAALKARAATQPQKNIPADVLEAIDKFESDEAAGRARFMTHEEAGKRIQKAIARAKAELKA